MPDAALVSSLDAVICEFRTLRTSSESSQHFWKKQALSLFARVENIAETRKEKAAVRPTLERTIQELENDLQQKIALLPGDYLRLLNRGKIKHRILEKIMDRETAVAVRRAFVAPQGQLANLPYEGFDYDRIKGACPENVIGYTLVTTGVAGPIGINGRRLVYVTMATTEGALVASTNRGCTAIMKSGGVSAHVFKVGMARAPVVQLENPEDVICLKKWVETPENFDKIKGHFEKDSRFIKLDSIDVFLDEEHVDLAHLRFVGQTGDAMGMNMMSKACEQAMKYIQTVFPTVKKIWLSGNTCCDKKAAAINWEKGRGRSVKAECVLSASVVHDVLQTTPTEMAEAARAKFDSGSKIAGTIGGGRNAHAANIVAAIYIATGQDPAQVVSSSMCETRFTVLEDGSLHASVTMNCVECGTVGGGTILPAQKACLQLMGVAGPSPPTCEPGTNANSLAEIIASTVLAGELSLMAALCTADLVSSHMTHNRSDLNLHEREVRSNSKPLQEQRRPIRGKPKDTTVKVNCSNIL